MSPPVLAALVAITLTDVGGWNLYGPSEVDVKFRMPGAVTSETITDGDGSKMHRYRSSVGKTRYTIVVGDVAPKGAAVYKKLWDRDRFGSMVRQLLDSAVRGAQDEEKGKLMFAKFGERNSCPCEGAALENPDGSGSVLAMVFTKKGFIFCGARGPRSGALPDEAGRLVDSLDLTSRK